MTNTIKTNPLKKYAHHLMLLDDDVISSSILQSSLEQQYGYKIDRFERAEDLFEALKLKQPDFILVDLHLMETKGFDVVKRIRETDPAVFVVIFSAAEVDSKVLLESLRSGADYYLQKPVTGVLVNELLTLMRENQDHWTTMRIRMIEERRALDNAQSLVDHMPLGLMAVNEQGLVSSWNERAVQMTGITSENIVGKRCPFRQALGEDYPCILKDKDAGCGVITEHQVEVKLQGRAFTFNKSSRLNEAPATHGGKSCLTVIQDVTDRVETERKLKLNEERYAIAQRAGGMGTWDWDLSSQRIYWSDHLHELLGFDDFDGRIETFYSRVHEDDVHKLRIMVDHAMRSQEEFEMEYRFLHEQKGYRMVQSRGKVIRDKMNHPERMLGVTQDITVRHKMQKEFESFYQAMQSSRHPMVITDVKGNITHANPAVRNLYGYTLFEMLGNNPRVLNAGKEVYLDYGYSEADYENIFSEMWEAISNPDIGEWHGEVYNRTKDGQVLLVDLYINTIRGTLNEPIGFVAMPIDVTDQRESQREVQLDIYRAISDLAETRDDETGAHLKRISILCQRLSMQLNLSRKFCEDIVVFSPLHDIGKVGIPDSILLAPRKLTEEEFNTMKTHSSLGYRILAGRPTLEMAAEIARWHHEHWNGNGYPDGIAGEVIPLSARIMAIADVYDALRSERRYKRAWTHEETYDYLKEKAGSQFDPVLIEAFGEIEQEIAKIYERMLHHYGKS